METDHISSNGSLFSWISNTEHLWKWKVLIHVHQITKYYLMYNVAVNFLFLLILFYIPNVSVYGNVSNEKSTT